MPRTTSPGLVLSPSESFRLSREAEKKEGKGKAFLGTVVDILSAPQRLIGGTLDDLNRGDIGSAINIFDNATDRENDPSKLLGLSGVGGLAADVILDPVNLLSGGLKGVASAGARTGLVATGKGGVREIAEASLKSGRKQIEEKVAKEVASDAENLSKIRNIIGESSAAQKDLKALQSSKFGKTESDRAIRLINTKIDKLKTSGKANANSKEFKNLSNIKKKIESGHVSAANKLVKETEKKIANNAERVSNLSKEVKAPIEPRMAEVISNAELRAAREAVKKEQRALASMDSSHGLYSKQISKTNRAQENLKKAETSSRVAKERALAAKTPEGRKALEAGLDQADYYSSLVDPTKDSMQAMIGLKIPFGAGVFAASKPFGHGSKAAKASSLASSIPGASAVAKSASSIFDSKAGMNKNLAEMGRQASNTSQANSKLAFERTGLNKLKIKGKNSEEIKSFYNKHGEKVLSKKDGSQKISNAVSRQFLNDDAVKLTKEGISKKIDLEKPANAFVRSLKANQQKALIRERNKLFKNDSDFEALSVPKNQEALAKRAEEAAEDIQKVKKARADFDKMDKVSKEYISKADEFLSGEAKRLQAKGLLKRGTRKGLYHPQVKEGLEEGLMEPAVRSSSIAPMVGREAGIQQKRVGGQFLSEDMDLLKTLSNYSRQTHALEESQNLSIAMNRMWGKTFPTEVAAKKAGYVKPSSSVIRSGMGKDTYVKKEIADSIKNLHDFTVSSKASEDLMRAVTKANNLYRKLAYTLAPGRLTVDFIGDTYNMTLNGINWANPALVSTGFREGTKLKKAIETGKHVNVKLGGKSINTKDLEPFVKGQNLYSHGRSLEQLGALGEVQDTIMGRAGSYRDNASRLTGFMMALDGELKGGKSLSRASIDASRRVKEAVFDYSELTHAEQRIMRNIMPFYTWTRKNLPYQLQKLIETPAGVANTMKLQDYSFENAEIPEAGMPNYMRNTFFALPFKVGGERVLQNPMLPSMDLGSFQNFRDGTESNAFSRAGIDHNSIFSMLSPFLRAPAEISSGRDFYTQTPIENLSGYGLRTFGGQLGGIAVAAAKNNATPMDIGIRSIGFGTGIRMKRLSDEAIQQTLYYKDLEIETNARNQEKRMEKTNVLNRWIGGQ